MRFEIEPNQFVIRVYDESHPDNYTASALIRVYGDRGWMSSITGAGFYEALQDHLNEILDKVGTKTLEGYVTETHARLMRVACRHGRGSFAVTHEGTCAGRRMVWVVLSKAHE